MDLVAFLILFCAVPNDRNEMFTVLAVKKKIRNKLEPQRSAIHLANFSQLLCGLVR